MKLKLLALLLVFGAGLTQALAQSKFNVSGTLIEQGTQEAVGSATVQVLAAKDSSYVTGVASDAEGAFTVKSLKKDKYILKISYIGFSTRCVNVDLSARKERNIDLGYITLSSDAIMLGEARVTGVASKVSVSGDSLVFNASAYRLTEGSTLEDLVKRLPGATVDEDGTVKINGKEVKKILLDGKEFFVNDKSIAMKNLPTNIIEKIKTYDRKSDLARVTGIDDGEEETVLDLTVKKGMNNGWFGQLQGAVGTEDRYNANANVNHFNGSNQYSLIASANNTGGRGGYGGGGGGRWGGWGRSNGLTTRKELGFNFATETEKLETGGYVWHNYDGSDVRSQSNTQNFVTSTGAFSKSTNQSYSSNARTSAGFRFEWKPDSMTNIIFRPSGSYSRNRGSGFGSSGTYDTDPNDYDDATLDEAEQLFHGQQQATDETLQAIIDGIVNTNASRNQSYSRSLSGSGELQLNRRLNSDGRNITLRLTGGMTNGLSRQLSASSVDYRQSSGRESDVNNRHYETPNRSRNYSIQATYSEPIAKRTYLQFSYKFSYSYSKNDRRANTFSRSAYNDLVDALRQNRYDIPGAIDQLLSQSYEPLRDDSLSQFSEYRNLDHTISVMFRMNRDKYNFNAGVDLLPQHSELTYIYMGHDYPKITRDVFNFTPSLNLRYRFNETSNLHFNFRGRTSQPSMTNLLDITDDSDPLNISKGNPGLKPSFSYNLRTFFNTFAPESQRSFFAHLGFNATRNQVAQRVSYNEATGVRTTRPENINGNWSANGGFGFNLPLDSKKYVTLNSFSNVGYNNQVSYLDPTQYEEEKSTTKSLSLGENLSIAYRNDWLDASINGNISYNHNENNVLANSRLNTYTFSYGAELGLRAPWGTNLNTDISMNSRRGYSQSSMNTNELLWNAQLSQSFLKGNALTIALEWNDILREQSNISRTINAMMSSDSRYNAIYSYGMLRVIYKLNIFAGKNANGTDNERDMWGNRQGDRKGGGGGRPPRR